MEKAKRRALFLPPLYQDSAEEGRLILRDGSTAVIRSPQKGDQDRVRDFFDRLSPESRYSRFFSVAGPDEHFLRDVCNSDFQNRLSLSVHRTVDETPRIIAIGSYFRVDDKTAEVAFAVEDAFQGKGIGAHLLERLALLAVRNGFVRFIATTQSSNEPMLELFRSSGFKVHEKREGGFVQVDFSVIPTKESFDRSEMLDRVVTAASLRPFFKPKSVAVVGASRQPGSLGYQIVQNLVNTGFKGEVYPINPHADVIGNVGAFHTIEEVPGLIDLAIIVVPAQHVLAVVEDCALHAVRAVVVITAGFAEVSPAGIDIQKKLVETVRAHGMRLIGPNCMGLMNTDPDVRLNASFSLVYPPHGRIAMSSQSGALGLAVLEFAQQKSLGLSTFVSVGNKADVSGNDLLQYWEEDPGTDVILLYLESFGNPRRFARIARRVSRSKPIVAVKSGRTKAGSRAAGSHTAAMMASDTAVEALFQQTGVIRANALEEMFDLAFALGSQPLPKGRRVGIITNAGGPGILCADTCEAKQLMVTEFSESTRARLAGFLPPSASTANPVDMIAAATPDQYGKTVELLLQAPEVDSLIIIYVPVVRNLDPVLEAIRRGVEAGRRDVGKEKPVFACFMTEKGNTRIELPNESIPTYLFPESAAHVLAKVARYAEWKKQPPGFVPDFEDMHLDHARQLCRQVLQDRGAGWLSIAETWRLMEVAQLPFPKGGIASNGDDAVRIANRIGFPVAMKLSSYLIVHKTEVEGVRLNLKSETDVRAAFQAIIDKLSELGRLDAMQGVMIQPMLTGGVEVMIGVTQDTLFGPLIAFGLGGIHVEILGDVAFRVTPLTDQDANAMIREIKGYRLLKGYRGHPAADIPKLEEMLLRVSRLLEAVPEITELDFNPVFAFAPGSGCSIADARVRLDHISPSLAKYPLQE